MEQRIYECQSQPKKIILLIHGYGANGGDLFGLKNHLLSSLGEDIIITAPDAPYRCETGESDYSRQWFSLSDRSEEALREGASLAHPFLKEYIEKCLHQYKLSEKELIIIGFSQGCMMALYTGLRLAHPPAAIIGWSGCVIKDERLGHEIQNKAPIQLWHGSKDEVVPLQYLDDTVKYLAEKGISAQANQDKMAGHTITAQIFEGSMDFIKKTLDI